MFDKNETLQEIHRDLENHINENYNMMSEDDMLSFSERIDIAADRLFDRSIDKDTFILEMKSYAQICNFTREVLPSDVPLCPCCVEKLSNKEFMQKKYLAENRVRKIWNDLRVHLKNLKLCLNEDEFKKSLKRLGIKNTEWM